jgi:dolichol-phosphate mannosyltransferase
VVADNCSDQTANIAEKKGAIVLKNEGVSGKGHALAKGFSYAKGDYIVMMDADYSHRAEDIAQFITALSGETVGLVIGSRFLGGSDEYTIIRTIGNSFLTTCLNILFGLKLGDSLNGYKAFRKEIVKKHPCSCSSFEVEIELIYNTLLERKKIVEIPSHERARAGGKMKSHAIVHGTKFLLCILNKGIRYNLWKVFN